MCTVPSHNLPVRLNHLGNENVLDIEPKEFFLHPTDGVAVTITAHRPVTHCNRIGAACSSVQFGGPGSGLGPSPSSPLPPRRAITLEQLPDHAE
jgi:hypothetical protein